MKEGEEDCLNCHILSEKNLYLQPKHLRKGGYVVYVYVGVGGFIGAIARYVIGLTISDQLTFPLATLIVNLFGSFLLAYVTFVFFIKFPVADKLKIALTTGVLGSFTTFSALSVETITLIENDKLMVAIMYVIISAFGGLFMAYLGYLLQRKFV